MPNIILRPGWHVPERLVTPEKVYRNRRHFLTELGFCGLGAMFGSTLAADAPSTNSASAAKSYPYSRNPEFNPANVRLTDEEVAISYNNFYEFSTTKTRVRRLTGKFVTSPWGCADRRIC
jgi:sulfoxide reductase catalytic subunit YedY